MARKPQKRKSEDLTFASFQTILNKLQGQSESDRACAVLATSALDAFLENLIKLSLVADFPETIFGQMGPLSSFFSKIELAYSTGLIAAEERADLHILRDIRNAFAHDFDSELSFETPKIAAHLQRLNLRGEIVNRSNFKDFNTNRSVFLICVACLCLSLSELRAKNIKRPIIPAKMGWATES